MYLRILFVALLKMSFLFQLNEDRNILEEAQGYEPKGTSLSKVCPQHPLDLFFVGSLM